MADLTPAEELRAAAAVTREMGFDRYLDDPLAALLEDAADRADGLMHALSVARAINRGKSSELSLPTSNIGKARTKARGYPDEMLREVAEVYRANQNRHPTRAVREAFGIAQSTAQLYVKKARERGFLAPREVDTGHG